ncbi:MAG: glycosyltransferase family 4 protein [Vicinamibacterales bacterium]
MSSSHRRIAAPFPVRIVHVLPQLRLGVGRLVVDLAKRQAARHGVGRVELVVAPDADEPWTSDPVQVADASSTMTVRIGGDFFRRSLPTLRSAASTIRAQQAGRGPWLAHAHTAMAAAVTRWAGAYAVVGTCYGVGPGRPPAFDLQDALAWAAVDAMSAASRAWIARLESEFGLAGVAALPGGIDPSRVPWPTAPGPAPRLVTVAELTRRKGVDVILSAVAACGRVLEGVDVLVIGRGDDEAALRAAARMLPPGARVRFAGHLACPPVEFRDDDIFLLASREDNQPVAAIEAMLAGLPLVVTEVGGLGEMVRDARCGIVVPADDVDALARAITTIVSAPRAERRRLGRAGREHALAHHSIEAADAACDALYGDALEAARARWGEADSLPTPRAIAR